MSHSDACSLTDKAVTNEVSSSLARIHLLYSSLVIRRVNSSESSHSSQESPPSHTSATPPYSKLVSSSEFNNSGADSETTPISGMGFSDKVIFSLHICLFLFTTETTLLFRVVRYVAMEVATSLLVASPDPLATTYIQNKGVGGS